MTGSVDHNIESACLVLGGPMEFEAMAADYQQLIVDWCDIDKTTVDAQPAISRIGSDPYRYGPGDADRMAFATLDLYVPSLP